jgi:hypothetical protein
MTNVLALRPPGNKIEYLCGKKDEVGGGSYPYPPLAQGKYLKPKFLPELDRLNEELREAKPNLVIALGNEALWALTGQTNIGSQRGATIKSPLGGLKVLPTYHPAGVLRQWSWRTIVIADLIKAQGEAQFPEIRRPSRQVIISPSISDIQTWTGQTLFSPPEVLAVDCETHGGQISCIGFARGRKEALVIPFIDQTKPGWNYWPTIQDEERAWALVEELLHSPIPKLFQNGLYDLQYICKMGLKPQNCLEDSMLLHHSMFPEMQKGLGFLGSIYTNESSWKLMRRAKPDTEKRDE